MLANPIAVRVARRHRAAVVVRDLPSPATRVEYACDGSISAFWLRMALGPQTGYLRCLRFRPEDGKASTTTIWEAVSEGGQVVTGSLVLRSVVTADTVATWAEVTVDPTP